MHKYYLSKQLVNLINCIILRIYMIVNEEKFEHDIYARTQEIFDLYVYYSKKLGLRENIDEITLKFEIDYKSDDINAETWVEKNVFNIRMNIGVIKSLMKYYNNIFSPIETKLKEKGIIEHDNIILEFNAQKDIKSLRNIKFPKCLNSEIVELVIVLSYRFIILHEFGHLFNGHCNFLCSLNHDKNFKLKMINNNKKDYAYALCERTLEYDADSFAATQSILYSFFYIIYCCICI